ncbi:sterol desaturase family protein [Pseudomonadota bacterium]
MDNELITRLFFFLSVFGMVAYWETRQPRRTLSCAKVSRWLNNLSLVVLNSVVLRLAFPTAAVGVAAFGEEQGWGLLNLTALPYAVTVLISVILLDLIIYLQHVLFHSLPLLWRLHMVHHTDLDYDVTTALRFHPIEIVLSMVIKCTAIIALGAPALAVIIFEIVLNACAMFNHGNLHLPNKIDKILRLFIITPDMHRVHHSSIKQETNSNYGFSLSIWDYLFGTYKAQPKHGHETMEIGLRHYRDKRIEHLHHMLTLPFVARVGEYPINKEDKEKIRKP